MCTSTRRHLVPNPMNRIDKSKPVRLKDPHLRPNRVANEATNSNMIACYATRLILFSLPDTLLFLDLSLNRENSPDPGKADGPRTWWTQYWRLSLDSINLFIFVNFGCFSSYSPLLFMYCMARSTRPTDNDSCFNCLFGTRRRLADERLFACHCTPTCFTWTRNSFIFLYASTFLGGGRVLSIIVLRPLRIILLDQLRRLHFLNIDLAVYSFSEQTLPLQMFNNEAREKNKIKWLPRLLLTCEPTAQPSEITDSHERWQQKSRWNTTHWKDASIFSTHFRSVFSLVSIVGIIKI